MLFQQIESVLCIGAHADDVEICAGGTISKMVRQGANVMALVCSESEMRLDESRLAMSHLGCNQLHGLGFRDTAIGEDMSALIHAIEKHVYEFKPDLVITHFHADTHQDHVSVYKAVVAAARKVPNFLMFKPTYPSGRPDIPFHATCISVLDAQSIQDKARAIKCFDSQCGKYGYASWAEAMVSIAQGDAWQYAGVHGWAEVFQTGRLML